MNAKYEATEQSYMGEIYIHSRKEAQATWRTPATSTNLIANRDAASMLSRRAPELADEEAAHPPSLKTPTT